MYNLIEVYPTICFIYVRLRRSQLGILVERIFTEFTDKQEIKQSILPTSMDVEEVCITSYDWFKMTAEMNMDHETKYIKDKLDPEWKSSFNKDKWMQLLSLMMLGNGITWGLMIRLNLIRSGRRSYKLSKMCVQQELVDLLVALPVCEGLV